MKRKPQRPSMDDDSFMWGPGLMQGSAHVISDSAAEEDAAEKVRKVAEEVSGKSFAKPARKIGFY